MLSQASTLCIGVVFNQVLFLHLMPPVMVTSKVFGGLRRGEKFTNDKLVVLETEAISCAAP